jgi:hypothetical protein
MTVPSRYPERARPRKAGKAQEIRAFLVVTRFLNSQHLAQKAEHGNKVIGEVKVCISSFWIGLEHAVVLSLP